MLIEFKFKNFTSYKDENSVNLVRVKAFKELGQTHVIKTHKDIDLLKSIAIFGSNGGGKSNLIEVLLFMVNVVHNSFAESLKKEENRGRTDYYFKLSTETENEPSYFEVSFIADDAIYRYGFEIKGFQIISEWLYKKVDVETQLFERKQQEFKINSKGFPEGKRYKSDVNSNVLFISHLAQNNTKEAGIIFRWFSNINGISGLEDKYHKNVTKNLLAESTQFKAWLSIAVKFLEITSIDSSIDKEIFTYHNKFDSNNIIVESVPLDFDLEESAGTRKLIYLLGAIFDTLINGKVLLIDELDAKLHPNLTKKLLEFFHKFNFKKSQFVFTAHDATILDKDILRRDQIWFVDRNKFGASEIYPMSDFDASVVRSTSDYRKKYLESVFGAAETIEITDDLIKLMHGEE